MDNFRGTGRTTRQIREAKPGALFIWCNGHIGYPKDLARELGRDDLRIERLSILEDGRLRGTRWPQIILDHAARDVLTDKQWDGLRDSWQCVHP